MYKSNGTYGLGGGISLAILLAGCMSASTPRNTATEWKPPSDAQKPDRVWADLRAQKWDSSKPLTLAELADVALQNNPATRKAWSDARAAAAQVEQARGYFMPTITGTAAASRQRTTASPATFDQTFTKYGPGLQLNYLILSFGGGRRAAVEAALETVYASDYAFNRSLQDVLLSVETAYYGLFSAQAGTEAAEASVKDAKAALEAAQAMKESGIGTKLDVLQAQAASDQSLYNLANAQGLLMNAHGIIAQALGIPADLSVQVVAPTSEVAKVVMELDMKQLIDDALQRRPDIAALRATLAAKRATARAIGSELWPSLFLNGNIARDYFDTTGGQKMQDSDWTYGGGLSIQWTLFDGLQTINARRAALAQADSVQAQLEQAELAASADVWVRYHNYETALQKYRFSSAFLKSTSASYDLALDSYKSGLKSILDLLTAESQLAQARSQQVAARQEAFTALANLAYATGHLEQGGSAQALYSTPIKKDHQP